MVNLFSLIKDYLVDKEDGIRQLIKWFLNVVMEEEAFLQSGAQRYERTNSRKGVSMKNLPSQSVLYEGVVRDRSRYATLFK